MSEATFNAELAKFDPTVDKLQAIAKEAQAVTITDFSNKDQIALVRTKRLELRDLRVSITKTGKSLRDEANAFAKAVIAKEKDLVAIITPEEDRLSSLETEAERLAEVERRKGYLPERKAKLEAIGVELKDEELLAFDDIEFVTFFNAKESERLEAERIALEEAKKAEEARKEAEAIAEAKRKEEEAKAEADRKAKEEAEVRAKAEAEQKKLDAEKAKLEAEKRQLEADRLKLEHEKEVEQARKEAEIKAKADAEAKQELDRIAEKKRLEDEIRAKEEAEKAEAESLARKAKWQKFLTDLGYTEAEKAEFYLKDAGETIIVYKKIGVYKK